MRHNLKVISIIIMMIISVGVFFWLHFADIEKDGKKIISFLNVAILYVDYLTISLVIKSRHD